MKERRIATEAKEYPRQNIVLLMGKENKKQTRKVHQVIITGFAKELKIKEGGH